MDKKQFVTRLRAGGAEYRFFDINKLEQNKIAQISRLPFVVNGHVGFFDKLRARWLADANCKIVKFGVESGSDRIRRQVLQRRMKNKKIVATIETAHQFGLHTSVFLMIGLPGETREDLMATIDLMARAQPGRYRWSFFFPFPDTSAFDIARDDRLNLTLSANWIHFLDRTVEDSRMNPPIDGIYTHTEVLLLNTNLEARF